MAPTLLACGSNTSSHLALNHPDDVSFLTSTIYHPSLPSLPSSCNILYLVSSSAHSLLLLTIPDTVHREKSTNILLGAGTNTFGQLGPRCALWDDIKPESRWKPLSLIKSSTVEGDWEPVKIASTWTTSIVVYQRISCFPQSEPERVESSSGSSAIPTQREEKVDQIVVSSGSNDFGELGSSSPIMLNAPAEIPISQASQNSTVVNLGLKKGEKVEIIRGGQRHVIVVISDKNGRQRVAGWGTNRKGELDPSTLSKNINSEVDGGSSSNGKGKGKGKSNVVRSATSPPIVINLAIPEGEKILDISLGASHTLALLSNGRLLAWGSDLKGQISGIHELDGVIGIAATWGGSYFLTSKGLYSQGSNTHSQLLRGTQAGSGSARGKVELEEGWKVVKIVAGTEHLLVHAQKGDKDALFSGGWNEHGNLALGDQIDRNILERVDVEGLIKGLWGGCASTWVWLDDTTASAQE
ncbi:uncharacterized protein IL334_007353 [Kwoniella shivajii]|uniref:Secretion-regulating guanine nucleotide exchange factor n=1 Tax=Kwoniella shivajii TaxID=564305 RepID=A0ABZ1DAK5_9TREE|nr:hypothetical protein IL334_007353 [Kwoniella shivajii]